MADNNVSDHSVVQIKDEDKDDVIAEDRNGVELIVSSIRGKLLQNPPSTARSCIFRIPNVLRRHNEKAFVPNLVSIGPFQHGKKNLKVMQEIKLWYLHCLLDRKPTSETSLEYLVEAIKSMEQDCRDCYGEKIHMSSEKFVEMMVVDGCFIVELFRKSEREVPVDEDDPVFNTAWMTSVLMKDLFLLENQLPWNVVDCLFHHTKEKDKPESKSLLLLALKFFEVSAFDQDPHADRPLETKHLLDGIRNSLLASYPQAETHSYWEPIPSVTELLQAGVEFKLRSDTWDNMLDITFKNGVMEIPPIDIGENAESLFRNLIAYEQSDPSIRDCNITSYAVILDNLINTSTDADFLIQKEIIVTQLSKEDIACLFNRLYSDTVVGYFCYVELTENVNAYYQDRWHRWQTILRRDYFSNPWSIFSLAAALLILGFTFLQTLYSLLTYY
ncbi:hypothetical protein PRUPE_7G208100 [Prunus persica]|uniref:Uncharacterized protein n=1 Tax=Prunus persica TaxID=3760 RepID=M5VTK3_PRUPE|nr:UPF0481 protein At3g47200 [Prunus persica]XP_020423422.1 UPF0481 protein At3g47200 [Prunus persica]XP_020423423.1 UPF0481 protein At3g47200 [Prunus persica]ONH97756.1 hypothetical protein PRUPE_7G208100 [Prunus persica]ONH97757.1 hypothetical protein PRUPE_7G208100 [Prunus persica]ONH97758.1 hypothetical protein PRUPE_7G208100 [Prunus persica]ONH97759.1 hypothetical protein PRUPE_7G208100 [Prunus persica]